MATAKDNEHLRYVAERGLVLVSQDDDFAALDAEWKQENKLHAGIMLLPKYLQGQAQISYAVRELVLYHELIQQGAGTTADIHNKVTYL